VRLAVLVPVKRFSAAKGRLSDVVDADQRARFAEWMATGVLEAVADVAKFVACEDEHVAEWATRMGARVISGTSPGLNGAVDDGIAHIAASGFDHVLVAHADLARPGTLVDVARADCITLVPDRRHDGTNVMSFPTAFALRASYGAASFGRHLEQAIRLPAAAIEVRRDPLLSLDLDTARDLAHPMIREVLPPWLQTTPDNPPH